MATSLGDGQAAVMMLRRQIGKLGSSLHGLVAAHLDPEPSAGSRSADAHIRQCIGHRGNRADVGIRAPTGRFMASGDLQVLDAHWDHEPLCGAPNSDSARWATWIA